MKGYAFIGLLGCVLIAQIAYLAPDSEITDPIAIEALTPPASLPSASSSAMTPSEWRRQGLEPMPPKKRGARVQRKRRAVTLASKVAISTVTEDPTPPSVLSPSRESSAGRDPALPEAAAKAEGVARRKVRGEFVSENVVSAQDFKNEEGSVFASNYFGIKFAPTSTESYSLRQQFSFAYPKKGESLKLTADDMFLSYTKANLATFGSEGSVTFLIRVYLPTGETSRRLTKHHGRLSPYLIASHPLGSKFSVDYHFVPSWTNHTRNGFVRDGQLRANTDYSLSQFFTFNAMPSARWMFTQAVGTTNRWTRPVATMGVSRSHHLYLDTSASFSGIPHVTLILGLSQEANIYNPPPNTDFRLYRDAETSYYLTIAASL